MPNTHKGIRGPAIFLAQFIGDQAPFDNLDGIARWAAEQGYQAIQLPTVDSRFIDLRKAAESQTYCDELNARCEKLAL
ncbi:hypothetical protein HORIV_53320 [Vreelandella olivaria]|uniref:AP endonuclease n=1 Tax=Vreelandella olivaria TaxID=390919 RepID=A0ABM7GPF2_9GAMM|nr:hypothetical protein HORIV_53320 [Halomonas olivaria]